MNRHFDLMPIRGRRWPAAIALTAALVLAAVAWSAMPGDAGAASGGFASPSSTVPEPEPDSGTAPTSRYDQMWQRLRRGERRWANRTAECESGRNPRAIGGGGLYRGAFQFMKSTWRASPRSPGGDPIRFSYRTQAVVAVLLKRRDGPGHWPNCG
ncbi:MAG TPA: transglycosylase family protein [Solirubrobacterales bacterium]|nr:transglycosylase family protein [Solirubrobacterales bacterium]